MNKTDLINSMVELTGFSKKDAGKAADAFVESVKKGVKEDGKVQIIGFGNFEKRSRAARNGRNPQTGEAIRIPASNTVGFKVSDNFKKIVNE